MVSLLLGKNCCSFLLKNNNPSNKKKRRSKKNKNRRCSAEYYSDGHCDYDDEGRDGMIGRDGRDGRDDGDHTGDGNGYGGEADNHDTHMNHYGEEYGGMKMLCKSASGTLRTMGSNISGTSRGSGRSRRSLLGSSAASPTVSMGADDSSLPTIDPDYTPNSSNFSLSDAGGTLDSQSQMSAANLSHATSAFGSGIGSGMGSTGFSAGFGSSSNFGHGYGAGFAGPNQASSSSGFGLYHEDNEDYYGAGPAGHAGPRGPTAPMAPTAHTVASSAATPHSCPISPNSSSLPQHEQYQDPGYHHRQHRRSHPREELLEIYAPAGKLGVVVDTPHRNQIGNTPYTPNTPGTPVIHAIKPTCPIRDSIRVGDKLVAVDDEDVRDMTATEVSRLISRKSGNERRKLTVIRDIRDNRSLS